MYAHSATRNYRKLIHSSIPRSRIIVLGLVVYMLPGLQGTRRETEKLRAMFKGFGVWAGWEPVGAWEGLLSKVITGTGTEGSRREIRASLSDSPGRSFHSTHFGGHFYSQYHFLVVQKVKDRKSLAKIHVSQCSHLHANNKTLKELVWLPRSPD